MHYHAEIWFPGKINRNEIEDTCDAFYDYYTIGGRYVGSHDNYEPSEDVRNYNICYLCDGTGKRKDMESPWGCNVCLGRGIARKFSNAPHEQDILPLKECVSELTAYTLIICHDTETFDHDILHCQSWDSKKKKYIPGTFTGNVKEFLEKEYQITDGYLVTIDYHSKRIIYA